MAAGDFYIRKNTSDTSAVPNAGGGNEDSGWDTLHWDSDSAGIVTYSDPYFQVDTGLYLIIYTEFFNTTDTTNNERIEVQGEIHVSGTGVVGGYGQDYIRKASGDQDCVVQGSMFLQVTSDNTDIFVRFYRTDNSTTGTVTRVPGHGSVTIIEMDDSSHNFGFYSASSSEATSGTTERTLQLNTNDKQDTGFSRSGTAITISNAGRYLCHFEMDVSQTATGREVVTGYLRKNGTTEIVGTRGFCYLRGADSCQDGAVSWIGIVDFSASDTVEVRWACPTSATITCAAGTGRLQMWQLPSGSDEAIMEATTGDYNADADFEWDTLPHIDTASFTATAGNSNIDVDQQDHCLVFATFAQVTDSTPQRATPHLEVTQSGTAYDYICGSGYHRNSSTSNFSVSIAGLATNIYAGGELRIHTEPIAETGALANTKGQFAVVSLESIWGYSDYVSIPVITDCEDEQINTGETDIVIDGAAFLTSQGTGKVELSDDADYATGTKVTQTIDSWSDTSIQFDSVRGALSDGTIWLWVTNDDGERNAVGYQMNLGVPSYVSVVDALSPNFYWTMQNTWLDRNSLNALNTATGGSPGFVTTPKLCRGDTHSLQIDAAGEYCSPPDITGMNLVAQTRRYMGGWVQVDSVAQELTVLYEEGAQVNNIAFLLGFGNTLMAQAADTSDDYVQAYSDFPLEVDRPYHIWFKFHASGYDAEFIMFIDGVEQTRSHGNPWTATDLDAHSGNITWGHEGSEVLQVGFGAEGVDIAFASPQAANYAHWASWHGVAFAEADVRGELFEKGATAGVTIAGGTEAAMQAALDVYADTVRPNWPIAIKVEECTAGDFELEFDNITFNERCSVQVQYIGADTLTLVTSNGTVVDSDLFSTPYGGTITVLPAVPVTVTVKDAATGSVISGAMVLLEEDPGGTDIIKTTTNGSGQVTTNYRYTTDQDVIGRVRKGSVPAYKAADISGTITAVGFSITVFMVAD